MKLKWAIVQSVHPDHDGVVRDVIVRYILLKPGPEPYISAFSKNSPFKTKLCSVEPLALMYSKEEQLEDMEKRLVDQMAGSSSVDMAINKRNSKKGVRQEVNLTKFDTANQQDKPDNEGKETKHKPIDGQDDYTRPAFASHPTLSHLHASDAMLKEQGDLQLHKDDQQEMDVQDPHHPSYWEPDDL